MALQNTDLSAAPFFDDYDETKAYQRILFRPEKTVQVRELNQLQSILQDQVNRIGKHLFEEGSVVLQGGINAKPDQDTIKVSFLGSITENEINPYISKLYIKSKQTTLEAKVLAYSPLAGSQPAGFAIEYTKTSDDGLSKKFSDAETCALVIRESGVDREVITFTVTSSHKGIYLSVLEGYYFIRGHVVKCSAQNIIAEPFNNLVTKRVGFLVKEEIIDETKDSSLYSNAQGAPNFKASGAARFKISLSLVSRLDTDSDVNFVEIARFQDGVLQRKVERTNYSLIEDSIAQRTYETNGDYIVSAYKYAMYEHANTSTKPLGLYPVAQGGDVTKFVMRLTEGTAYVQGYRGSITGFEDVKIDKALDTNILNNSVMYAEFGNYIVVNNINSLPPFDIKKRLNLLASDGSTITGTCSVRAIKRESSTSIRLYVFDITMNSSYVFPTDAKKVRYSDATNLFTGDVVGNAVFNATKDVMIFNLPFKGVKSMVGSAGVDTSYSVARSYDLQLNASGVGSISLPSGESFVGINTFDYLIAGTSATGGTIYDPTTTLSLSGTPVGRTLNINIPSEPNAKVRVSGVIIKTNPVPRTKTLKTQIDTVTFTNESRKVLTKCDINSITSITKVSTGVDERKFFKFFDGQRPNWYEVGAIYTANNTNVNGVYTVEYTYFEHSTGDYFNVDSYGGMARELIPTTNSTEDKLTVSLADCLDFRPTKDSSGTFNSFSGDIVDPSDSVRFDLTYYMPRKDIICQTPDKKYVVVKGVAADNPAYPFIPSGYMDIFRLDIPAYTDDVTRVLVTPVPHRRYTMQDIGTLDTRIGNLEYYVSLSMLENSLNTKQIIDPTTGNNRFKNGFFADDFTDFSVADVTDPEFDCVLEKITSDCAPRAQTNGLDLQVLSKTNAYTNIAGVKSYTSVSGIYQPYATTTTNINPYAVFNWNGLVELSPSSDYWQDTVYLPPILKNEKKTVDKGDLGYFFYADVFGFSNSANAPWSPAGTGSEGFRTAQQAIESWAGSQISTAEARGAIEFGLNDWVSKAIESTTVTTTNNSVDALLSSSVIPFMRSIPIKFTLKKFRPYANLNAYFDGKKVTQFCTPSTIFTDINGNFTGVFTVPNTTTDSFLTGIKLMEFTDGSAPRSLTDEFTYGSASFGAGGVSSVRQRTITTTETTTTSRSVSYRLTAFAIYPPPPPARRQDPIAQTFVIENPNGRFITRIGIAFATKSQTIPVSLEIRTCTAGLPDYQVVPNGISILNPNEITTSTDGDTLTYFEFKDPLLLAGNVEYALVLKANTQEYNVYKAVMGQPTLGAVKTTIAKQPNIGVFLSSSNAFTWTPHQIEDLKFDIQFAEFSTTDSVIEFDHKPTISLPSAFNCLSMTLSSNSVKVGYVNHGLKVGDPVIISGYALSFGIPESEVNKTQTVTGADVDWFTFQTTTSANATGTCGANSVRIAVNYPITEILPYLRQVITPNTSVLWEYMITSQSSRAKSAWIPFLNNDALMPLPYESIVRQGVSQELKIRATLKSSDKTMSPIIDVTGAGLQLVGRRLNNDFNNPVFRYVTRSIKFDNPSTSARVWINASLPASNSMKVYYKLLTSGDQTTFNKTWTELLPSKPIANSVNPTEYEYQLSNVGTFVGVKFSVVFCGTDPALYPSMGDFRCVALA